MLGGGAHLRVLDPRRHFARARFVRRDEDCLGGVLGVLRKSSARGLPPDVEAVLLHIDDRDLQRGGTADLDRRRLDLEAGGTLAAEPDGKALWDELPTDAPIRRELDVPQSLTALTQLMVVSHGLNTDETRIEKENGVARMIFRCRYPSSEDSVEKSSVLRKQQEDLPTTRPLVADATPVQEPVPP